MQELAQHAWIAFDETMANHRAARSGLGLAALPTAIADGQPELQRVLGPVAELTGEWRGLAHRDLHRAPHVAAFFAFVVAQADAFKPLRTG